MNEVTKQSESNVPDHLRSSTGETGAENMSAGDTVVPRIKICQGLSKVKQENRDIVDGDIYNNMEKKNLGQQYKFYVLRYWRSKVWFEDNKILIGTEFKHPKDPKRIIQFGKKMKEILENAELNATGKDSFNYMIVDADAVDNEEFPPIAIFSALSAACKPAKQLNYKLQINASPPNPKALFAERICMGTVIQSFKDGDAYMPTFSFEGEPSVETGGILKMLFEQSGQLLDIEDTHIKGADEEGIEEKDTISVDENNPFADEE